MDVTTPTYTATGPQGGSFSPNSVDYTITAQSGTVSWRIAAKPDWLDASALSGSADTNGSTVTFTVNSTASSASAGQQNDNIQFVNFDTGNGNATRNVALKVLALTSTALGSSSQVSVFGQSVTLTATVTSGSCSPTGTVSFFDGATLLEAAVSLSSGQASTLTSALTVGSHTITATYDGDSNCSTSTSSNFAQTVNKGATTTTLGAAPSPAKPSQQVTLTATVAATAPAAGTRTGSVTFKDGAATLGTGNLSGAGVATFTTSAFGIGAHSLTARYNGDSHFAVSTSAAKSETVSANVGAEFKINTFNGGASNAKQAPAIARLADGSSVVVWESTGQDGSGTGVYGQRYTSAGAKAGGEFHVSTATANDQKQPSVAPLLLGGFVVVWTSTGQDGSGLGVYA